MDVIEILKDLIKINTTNPPGNEKLVADYIKSLYKDHKEIKEIEHGDNRSSIVIDIKGDSGETIAFVGHIDTVPVSDTSKWKYDPFGAVEEDGLIYGRGTSDMKSGAACMVSTGLYFIENDIVPTKNIRLVFTADEESDGMGVSKVLEEGYLNDVDSIIVPENTDEYMVIKEKGALWVKVKIYGRAAHGARPDLGLNSIEILYEFVNAIRPFVESHSGDDLLGDSSLSLNKISGGEKTNIIADYCEAEIDIRTIPSLKNEDVIDYIETEVSKLMKKYPDLKIELETINNRPALSIEEDHEFILEFKKVLDKLDMESKIKGVNYFTDLSITMPVLDKPFVIYGPGFESKGHQVDECVEVDAVKRVRDVYIECFK